MRTWVKATLGGLALIAIAIAALGGTGAYFILRSLDKQTRSESDAVRTIDAIKARFGTRPPLVEIGDPRRVDVTINRPPEASLARVETVHVLNWKRQTGELVRVEVPLWLTRFSSLNVLSQLGVTPAQFRLTVDDIERYGPGILVDYGSPGVFRILVWVD
jgi:hypothetical protein